MPNYKRIKPSSLQTQAEVCFIIAAKMKELRAYKDISQEKLGKEIGRNRQQIADIELCRSKPVLLDLVLMSEYFNVPLGTFFTKGDNVTDGYTLAATIASLSPHIIDEIKAYIKFKCDMTKKDM
jgi:transcriptional regulator with XRE-family HTH domain